MINDFELVEWQRRNRKNGLVECWFTHDSLNWMNEQNWSDKNAIAFGAGLGDAWLAKKCKNLVVIERDAEWIRKASTYAGINGTTNIKYIHRKCNDCDGQADYYTSIPVELKFDIIINDDAYRTELCQVAVDYFKNNGGGILICDNWQQSYVWMSPKAEEILAPFDKLIFEQLNHTDNDGKNKWKTAIFFIS